MNEYQTGDVLRVARRIGNPKRTYLLVNPLQAKHIPVQPTRALDMMHALGRQLAEKYPDTGLIVGFAETATAIGAAVASCFGLGCRYMHTTRESLGQEVDWILFLEEHSHAMEQRLHRGGFLQGLRETGTVIFVEDEISTGRTLLNMLRQLRGVSGAAAKVRMVAASVINRLSEENERLLQEAGIDCEYLVKLPEEDYDAQVADWSVAAAEDMTGCGSTAQCMRLQAPAGYPNPRLGADFAAYQAHCQRTAEAVAAQLSGALYPGMRLLVLGTEECMYPALVVGQQLEKLVDGQVYCHATTRSPIGVQDAADYPIRNGYRIRSFYEMERVTFLYNLDGYDAVVIVTDASPEATDAVQVLQAALGRHGACPIYDVRCGERV